MAQKRKYAKMGDEVKGYECTNKKCKWQGTDEQKGTQYLENGFTELICPKCCKNEFYGLLPSYVDSISAVSRITSSGFVLLPKIRPNIQIKY